MELSIEPGGQDPEFAAFQAMMVNKGIPWTAFQVDDMDAEHARLTDMGVAFRGSPADCGDVRAATLDDTCGNLIMLYSMRPTAA